MLTALSHWQNALSIRIFWQNASQKGTTKMSENKETLAPLTADQIKSVKGLGFLHNRGTRCFNGRIITKNGVLSAEQLRVISEAAQKYGSGTATFTVRLTLEIPGIEYENIENFRSYIERAGLFTGGTGAKVRPVVACKGTTCVFGLCDTQSMAADIHDRFFEGYRSVVLPHKFKIAVGGCPNNCVKPDLNDFGIVGQRVMKYKTDICRGCKKCGVEQACPMKAASVADGKLSIDKEVCNNCSRCMSKCPFGVAADGEHMLRVYIGGRWGKKIRLGTRLSGLFTQAEALDLLEKTILFFKRDGITGERLGETIDRIGAERVEALLLSNELLDEKDAILSK